MQEKKKKKKECFFFFSFFLHLTASLEPELNRVLFKSSLHLGSSDAVRCRKKRKRRKVVSFSFFLHLTASLEPELTSISIVDLNTGGYPEATVEILFHSGSQIDVYWNPLWNKVMK